MALLLTHKSLFMFTDVHQSAEFAQILSTVLSVMGICLCMSINVFLSALGFFSSTNPQATSQTLQANLVFSNVHLASTAPFIHSKALFTSAKSAKVLVKLAKMLDNVYLVFSPFSTMIWNTAA